MLHIVNKSHMQSSALQSCLRPAKDGHAVLLTEDAVYAATAAGAAPSGIAAATARVRVYALLPDLEARGVAAKLAAGVTGLDYGGFVDLVAENPNSQSWL